MTDEKPFRLEEATIDELHEAIKAGQVTCVAVVQHYVERSRAYNGVASLLVTDDGAPVPEATGTVRATAPLRFPTETVPASAMLPSSTNTRDRSSNSGVWRRRPPTPRCNSNMG